MSQNNEYPFIGTTFNSKKGGIITVVGVLPRIKNTNLKYICSCSICSEDSELWPNGSVCCVKSTLVAGSSPCGCAVNPKWSKSQTKIRVERCCVKMGYILHGFVEPYIGNRTKLILENPRTGNVWDSTKVSHLLDGHGDSVEFKLRLAKMLTLSDEEVASKYQYSKTDSPCTFKRNPYRNECIDVTCPICSVDEYVKSSLCSGVFTAQLGNLHTGKIPCRCSGNFVWTKEQREYQIKKVCDKEGFKFLGWIGTYKYGKSKFSWRCAENHLCENTNVSNFLYNNRRCKTCAEQGGINGYYPDRVDEDDNLYLILFKTDTESFFKVGRSFDVTERMKDFPDEYSLALVTTYQSNHQNVYDIEQEIHRKLKYLGYHYTPTIPFGGSVRECFTLEALPLAQEIFAELKSPPTEAS